MRFGAAILFFVTVCVLGLAPQTRAGTIAFTAPNGPFGGLTEDGTGLSLGTFIWNVFDGGLVPIGVSLFGGWNQSAAALGFHVDFTGAFSLPRSITGVQFTNQNDILDPTDDVTWLGNFTALTATFNSTGPGDVVANGEYWDAGIRFNDQTGGSLGFTGYFVVEETGGGRVSEVPEPGTLVLIASGMTVLGYARRKRRAGKAMPPR
jgi:hypothetical protein